MKNKIYVTNSFDFMKVDGIYDIRSITNWQIAELAKDYEFINCGNNWVGINTETGDVSYINVEPIDSPEFLDLSEKVFCKILFIQESGNKLIEYATVTGETPACIYFP
jgi:hypothetical protein